MDVRARHPLSAAFGDVPEDEFTVLVADIKVNGLLNAIVTSEDGRILDGWNRYRACLAAGVPPRFQPFAYVVEPAAEAAGRTPTEAEFVIAQNAHRRHLTREQRRNVIAELLKVKPEASNRAIAAAVKLSHNTVAAVREELQATGQVDQLTRTTGRDGKARPATKPKPTGIEATAARAVGMSERDYAQAREVVEAADQDHARFDDIVQTMDATGNVTEAYNELQRRRGVGEAMSERDREHMRRIAEELRATQEVREMLKPTSAEEALNAWIPIVEAMRLLHKRTRDARRLPECPPTTKRELIDMWESVACALGALLEVPAARPNRTKLWKATIALNKPDRAVETLLKAGLQRDLVKLYSEFGYALHQRGAITKFPEAMREVLAKIDADNAQSVPRPAAPTGPTSRMVLVLDDLEAAAKALSTCMELAKVERLHELLGLRTARRREMLARLDTDKAQAAANARPPAADAT